MSTKDCNISETVKGQEQGYYNGLIGSRIRTVINYLGWPWTAETHFCENPFTEPSRKFSMKIRIISGKM